MAYIVGKYSENKYNMTQDQVDRFEQLYLSSLETYSQFLVTCKKSVTDAKNNLSNGRFKRGVTYRINERFRNTATGEVIAMEINDGALLHWFESDEIKKYFKPAK